jgi:hypothetical protein
MAVPWIVFLPEAGEGLDQGETANRLPRANLAGSARVTTRFVLRQTLQRPTLRANCPGPSRPSAV